MTKKSLLASETVSSVEELLEVINDFVIPDDKLDRPYLVEVYVQGDDYVLSFTAVVVEAFAVTEAEKAS